MNARKYLTEALFIFAIVLLVSIVVTFLYSLIAHGQGVVDWESGVRLAIIFAIVVPWVQRRKLV